MTEKRNGTVKWFSGSYGFITDMDGNDTFVHWRGILGDGFKTLEAGQCVIFEVEPDEKSGRLRAVNVWTIDDEEGAISQ